MNNVEAMKELNELLGAGILTQEEYDTEKAKLVDATQPVETDERNAAPETNVMIRLKEIKTLHDNKLITDDEYAQMRNDVLGTKPAKSMSIPSVSTKDLSKKLNNKIVVIAGAIVSALLLFVVVGSMTQTSQDKLGKQVAAAVTSKDSKKLLANFSEENQKLEWALPGVSELMNNWRHTNSEKIVEELANGVNVNTQDDWADVKVTVKQKPHMFFWKNYYLDVQPTRIKATAGEDNFVLLKSNIDDDTLSLLDDAASKSAAKEISVKNLEKNGIFPGSWTFDVKDKNGNKISSGSYITSYGRSSEVMSVGFD